MPETSEITLMVEGLKNVYWLYTLGTIGKRFSPATREMLAFEAHLTAAELQIPGNATVLEAVIRGQQILDYAKENE